MPDLATTVLELVRETGILRPRDLDPLGIPRVYLSRLQKAWRPRVAYPRLRIVRFSKAALCEGVEEHKLEGVPVRLLSVARTVADCFKYRNKIGLDVAIEGLRECRRQPR